VSVRQTGRKEQGCRLGRCGEGWVDAGRPGVRAARGQAASWGRQGRVWLPQSAGGCRGQVSLPSFAAGLPAYYVIATSEASANLARFDGVRYGPRHQARARLRRAAARAAHGAVPAKPQACCCRQGGLREPRPARRWRLLRPSSA